MPGGESNNEKAVNKPKNREEEQKERIQRKIDKLQKKEKKFNDKLIELNKNATETQKDIAVSTRNKMDLVVGLEINKNLLETNGVTTVDSKIGLEKIFSSPDNHNTITVGGTLGVGKQFKNYIAPQIQTEPGSAPSETGAGTGPENPPGEVGVEYTHTTANKKNISINPNIYINPELYIKTKNDKGLTFGATVGGAVSSNQKIAYASGNVGYETKGGLGLEATGGAKINVNTANITPYGGLNLYKTFGDFKINLGTTTSTKNQLRVGGGITYNF